MAVMLEAMRSKFYRHMMAPPPGHLSYIYTRDIIPAAENHNTDPDRGIFENRFNQIKGFPASISLGPSWAGVER